MVLEINNRAEFLTSFLVPLSRINNACVIKVSSRELSALLPAVDNTIILYAKYETDTSIEDSLVINLPDIGRLNKIL